MNEQNLFPERELIDMTFMEYIRFSSFVPVNKTELDIAIQEYNCLSAKFSEATKEFSKRQKDLENKYDLLAKKISDAMNNVTAGVEQCVTNNWTDYNIHYGDDDKCELNFEHGKLILEQKTSTKFKIKPVKEK